MKLLATDWALKFSGGPGLHHVKAKLFTNDSIEINQAESNALVALVEEIDPGREPGWELVVHATPGSQVFTGNAYVDHQDRRLGNVMVTNKYTERMRCDQEQAEALIEFVESICGRTSG